jgi:hypothetical protein
MVPIIELFGGAPTSRIIDEVGVFVLISIPIEFFDVLGHILDVVIDYHILHVSLVIGIGVILLR